MKYFCELAGLPFDRITSIFSYIINIESCSSFEWINLLQFDYIVGELTNFIGNSDLFQDIFLDMDS